MLAWREPPLWLLRLLAWGGGLGPLLWLGWEAMTRGLGPVPEERLLHASGQWGLALLLATLALGPTQRLTAWRGLARLRRPLGLLAFAWLSGHLLVWLWLDQWFGWPFIVTELTTLRHLQVGLLGYLLLVPLALTSTRASQLRLGLPGWRWLHRLGYAAAAAGVLHWWLLTRADYGLPTLYGLLLLALIGWRLLEALRRR